MQNLYKTMVTQNLKVHGLGAGVLACAILAEKALGIDLWAAMVSMYVVMSSLLFFFKPFSSVNWKWLKTLPVSRRNLFFLVLSESLTTIALSTMTVSVLVFVRHYKDLTPIDFHHFWDAVRLLAIHNHGPYVILFLIAASPILILVLPPLATINAVKSQSAKSIVIAVFGLSSIVGALYLVPILTLTFGGATLLGSIGAMSVSSIFPARKYRLVSRSYAAIVALSLVAILITHVELMSEAATRPVMRMKYYEFLAPRMKSSELLSLLALPSISDSARMEIAEFERRRRSEKELISLDELREWSEKAGAAHIYFQGLVLFENQEWTAPALMQLENDLKKRCSDKIARSKWAPTWKCDLGSSRLKDSSGPLNIAITVKSRPALLSLISTDHPLISSMLIQSSLHSASNESWKAQIEALAKSKSPVISEQAQMWLDRFNLNKEGHWDCSSHRRNPASVCSDANTVDYGLGIENQVVGDPGGSISIYLSR